MHLSRAKRLARGAALTAPLQSRDRPASHGVFTIQKLDGAGLWRREVGCLIVALSKTIVVLLLPAPWCRQIGRRCAARMSYDAAAPAGRRSGAS